MHINNSKEDYNCNYDPAKKFKPHQHVCDLCSCLIQRHRTGTFWEGTVEYQLKFTVVNNAVVTSVLVKQVSQT